MKVKTIFLAISLIVGLLISSCGSSSKTCPAYGKADIEQNDNTAG
jgi:hypothetical protein